MRQPSQRDFWRKRKAAMALGWRPPVCELCNRDVPIRRIWFSNEPLSEPTSGWFCAECIERNSPTWQGGGR